MPHMVFRLNNVPEEEADDIRRLLDERHIDYYETDAGRWGFSVAAIWLRDDDSDRVDEALTVIAEYQERYSAEVRERHERERREGRHETLLQRFIRHPLQFVFYLLALLAILYLSTAPFFDLAGD